MFHPDKSRFVSNIRISLSFSVLSRTESPLRQRTAIVAPSIRSSLGKTVEWVWRPRALAAAVCLGGGNRRGAKQAGGQRRIDRRPAVSFLPACDVSHPPPSSQAVHIKTTGINPPSHSHYRPISPQERVARECAAVTGNVCLSGGGKTQKTNILRRDIDAVPCLFFFPTSPPSNKIHQKLPCACSECCWFRRCVNATC